MCHCPGGWEPDPPKCRLRPGKPGRTERKWTACSKDQVCRSSASCNLSIRLFLVFLWRKLEPACTHEFPVLVGRLALLRTFSGSSARSLARHSRTSGRVGWRPSGTHLSPTEQRQQAEAADGHEHWRASSTRQSLSYLVQCGLLAAVPRPVERGHLRSPALAPAPTAMARIERRPERRPMRSDLPTPA